MTDVERSQLLNIKQELITAQSMHPSTALDWNIYQGQIDLLERVMEVLGDKSDNRVCMDPITRTLTKCSDTGPM